MKRKIFISINLPEKAEKSLFKATEEWRDLPVKWVKEENLHITLSFLGHIADEAIAEICEKVRKAAEKHEIFDIEFDTIEAGPSPEEPRLIWLSGEPNEELKKLFEDIEKGMGIFSSSKKAFRPHITLGRIRQHKWQALEAAPRIKKKFTLIVTAESADVMASEFENEGREYTVVERCLLK